MHHDQSEWKRNVTLKRKINERTLMTCQNTPKDKSVFSVEDGFVKEFQLRIKRSGKFPYLVSRQFPINLSY